ncbi:MAG: ABC transporter permease [Burkholderiales bacterium]|jgi:ABC-2 type transport system permease protein|nr:ABC transporter permease [Burkholderiales bacterium]
MNAFIALVRKDLVLYFSNRRSVLMSIAAPILIAAFFGSLFGGSDSKPANIPIAITDLDRSELSAKIVAALRADSALTVSEASEADALAQVKAGKLRAAVTLPLGFGERAARALFGGADKPEIVLNYDPSQSMVLPLVRGLLAQHVMEHVSQSVMSGASPLLKDMREQVLQNKQLPAERRDELVTMFDSIARVQSRATPGAAAASGAASAAPSNGPTFSVPFSTREVEASSNPETKYNSYSHSFAGMGVQFILLMGVDVAVGLLMMRRLGLWKRLRAAPLSRAKLLGSRITSCALIAIIVFAVIYAVAMAFFKVRVDGSVIGFLAVLVSFALLTACFGLLIAALGKTPEATRGLAILATLLLVMLGGAWVPSFIFPAWLQTVSLFVPTRWAIDGLDAMTWRGLPIEAALLPVAVMLAFSAVFAAIAIARFEWEE